MSDTPDYISFVVKTESRETAEIYNRFSASKLRILHATMGVATEAGELLDAVKKHYFYGKPLDEVNLIEEMGDIFWYLGVLADVLGTTFEEVQRLNILKLQKRYGDKFNKNGALHRDLDAERKVLEGK